MTIPKFPSQSYFHGTKVDFQTGDLIQAGYNSNYGQKKVSSYVYFSGTLNASIWGAELAQGEERGRVYVVEPTGPVEDDPNLTDKKFPGNPTLSYRSKDPIRVIGEVKGWKGHLPEEIQHMKDNLEKLKAQGIEAID